jgi:hypothetical protein
MNMMVPGGILIVPAGLEIPLSSGKASLAPSPSSTSTQSAPKKPGHLLARQPRSRQNYYWMVRVNVVEAVMFGLLLSVAVTVTV